MKPFLTIYILLFCTYCYSQYINVFSDYFHGGVTGSGFNASVSSGQIDLNIPTGSTIKKAYLFASATRLKDFNDFPADINLSINNQNVVLSVNNTLNNNYTVNLGNQPLFLELKTIVKDITNLNIFNINNLVMPIQDYYEYFNEFYILVLYNNSNMPLTAIDVFVNKKNSIALMNYNIISSLKMNTNNPIGLALNTSHICDTIHDGSFVFVNSDPIGLIGGNDYNTSAFCSGTTGSFFYQNNSLYGLGDDNADNYMYGSDAIANIQQYITNNQDFNLTFQYQSNQGSLNNSVTNSINQIYLTYTSPCSEFPVTTSPDTSVCKGSTLQLNASGGVQYEWLPFAGLSCSNCPNPIVQTDSSQFYTVRIWNNDSCSVVRPVHVTVYQPAKFSGISISPATCGEANGQLTATLSNTAYLPLSFSVNNAPFQNSSTYTKQFQNLPYGPLLLTAKDGHQCTIDTLLTIPYNNTCSALFTASPSTGATPLNVQFSNQSTNATNYAWEINATSLGSILNNHIFDTAGTYFVQLYAWQNIPECIDSFSVQIIVFDSLVVQVPNVFTVNNDGVNDVFSLSSNQQITVAYSIVDRWGTVAASGTSKSLPITNGVYTTTIWDGRNATNGVYFYTITLQSQGENKIVNGFVERLD
jgi:PKD repeat protein